MKALAFIIVWFFRGLIGIALAGIVVEIGYMVFKENACLKFLGALVLTALTLLTLLLGCMMLYDWAKSRLDR